MIHHLKKLAAAALALSLATCGLSQSANATVTAVTQTYSTAWDVTPAVEGVVRLPSGKTLLLTTNSTGDPQVGLASELVATTSDADSGLLNSSVTIASGYYSFELARIKMLADASLFVVFKAHKVVRLKDRVEYGYSISTDNGATWSVPTLLPDGSLIGKQTALQAEKTVSLTRSVDDLEIIENSSHNISVFAKTVQGQLLGYYRTASISSPSWSLILPSAPKYDFGFTEASDFSDFGGGQQVQATWGDDVLTNLTYKSSAKGLTISTRTYQGFSTSASLTGITKIIDINSKQYGTLTAKNDNGDVLVVGMYTDAKKKVKITFRVFTAATSSWSKALTKDLGLSKNVPYPQKVWLANDRSWAFESMVKISKYEYAPKVRLVNVNGTFGSYSDSSWMTGDYFDEAIDYENKYLGGGNFEIVQYQATEDNFGNQVGGLVVIEGNASDSTSTDIEVQAEPSFYLNSGGIAYVLVESVGEGLTAGTEVPNTISVINFALGGN